MSDADNNDQGEDTTPSPSSIRPVDHDQPQSPPSQDKQQQEQQPQQGPAAQPGDLESGVGRDSTEPNHHSLPWSRPGSGELGEPRSYPLAPESTEPGATAASQETPLPLSSPSPLPLPSPSLQDRSSRLRYSTLSGRSINLDKLFSLRESIQLSISDPSATGSGIRNSDGAIEGEASTSTHTLTHGAIPDEVDAFNGLQQDSHDGVTGIISPGTVTFTTLDEKNLSSGRRDTFSNVDFGDEDIIIAWEEEDPENPYNWSSKKKARILITSLMLILNSTMGSALPSNAIPFIAAEWGVTERPQEVLPISVYLIGYVMGPIFWAPLTEQYGRKNISLGTFIMFSLSTLACALAPTWASFLVFRLLAGVFASAPVAIVTGIIADIYGDPRTRGRSMGIFMASTVFGPLIAPIISGFTATTIGWRWAFWIGLMYAGATLTPLVFMPETFSPVLLLRRARAIRKRDPFARVVAPHELEKKTIKELTTVVCTRPIRMIIFEPIVNTSCAYLSLCYGIFYMSFEAFPLIYQGVYKLSPGMCGLTYLSIGVGALLGLPVFFTYDTILRRAQEKDAGWTHQEEYRRLPLACIGGPMFVISLFWLGWTSREDVPMFVPLLAGIPFGLGFMCIFQALLNYLTDAYEIFAASAHAAASTSRSLLATVLPFATTPMFAQLGIAGACSLLGGLSLLMCVIPFVFLWQGNRIRANSGLCTELRRRKEEMAFKIEEQRRKRMTYDRMTAGSSSSTTNSAVGRSVTPPSGTSESTVAASQKEQV